MWSSLPQWRREEWHVHVARLSGRLRAFDELQLRVPRSRPRARPNHLHRFCSSSSAWRSQRVSFYLASSKMIGYVIDLFFFSDFYTGNLIIRGWDKGMIHVLLKFILQVSFKKGLINWIGNVSVQQAKKTSGLFHNNVGLSLPSIVGSNLKRRLYNVKLIYVNFLSFWYWDLPILVSASKDLTAF